jgi:hypothetical protein
MTSDRGAGKNRIPDRKYGPGWTVNTGQARTVNTGHFMEQVDRKYGPYSTPPGP